MKQITLKPFQIGAIEELKSDVLHKWRRNTRQNVRFQSPTGSGKTVMMAQLVRDLVNAPELLNADFAFLWVSIGGSHEGDLASQSRNKFNKYYGGASEVQVTDLDSLDRDKVLQQNEVLFFNWSKIKTRNKEGRRLRRENEQETTWDGMLQRTREQKRDIILIIDEAHISSRTLLAEEEVNLINPKVVIRVTATHRDQGGIDVNIAHDDVVRAGLIKESIKSQTREDFKDKQVDDLDIYVLRLAIEKRKKLADLYRRENIEVNPLLMIQLPNDDKVSQEEGETKKETVLRWLKAEGIDENTIAVWLDREKTNLENITINNRNTDILLFKQAPATGWDCPRAQVLLMYRETKDPVFQTQVLGRVLRMPEGKHYKETELNHSYLYTTYTKNEIIESYDKYQGENQAAIFHSHIKTGIEQIKLKTFVSQRTSYNDLGKTFQFTFIDVAQKFNAEKPFKSYFDFGKDVKLELIVNQNIRDYDGFIRSIKEADSMGQKMSHNDIEKLYKKLCIEVLHKQEGETRFKNIARSYGKLKSAINVWFESHLGVKDKDKYYPCVVNDLNKGANSILLPVINEALEKYVLVRSEEEKEKDKRKSQQKDIVLPLSKISYTSNYEEIKSDKCALCPCYVNKENKNERKFISYLEGNQSVEWWYKNGDNGSEHFSVKRSNGNLFYPDWFIKTKNDIWIIDTKGGFTAQGEEANSRAEALENWLKQNKKFKGGLVKNVSGVWQIAEDKSLNEWVDLVF